MVVSVLLRNLLHLACQFVFVHDFNTGRGRKMEHCFCNMEVFLPVAEAKLRGYVTGLLDQNPHEVACGVNR